MHQAFLGADKTDRLFVPLANEAFEWFSSGLKKWELRRVGRQYTPKHVRVGRRVELRRGYRGRDVLWGEIADVVQADNIHAFFDRVPYQEVVPTAKSREHAIEIVRALFKVDLSTPLLGFLIDRT